MTSMVQEKVDEDAIFIFGAAVCDDMEDELSITVIATGFAKSQDKVDFRPASNTVGLDEKARYDRRGTHRKRSNSWRYL